MWHPVFPADSWGGLTGLWLPRDCRSWSLPSLQRSADMWQIVTCPGPLRQLLKVAVIRVVSFTYHLPSTHLQSTQYKTRSCPEVGHFVVWSWFTTKTQIRWQWCRSSGCAVQLCSHTWPFRDPQVCAKSLKKWLRVPRRPCAIRHLSATNAHFWYLEFQRGFVSWHDPDRPRCQIWESVRSLWTRSDLYIYEDPWISLWVYNLWIALSTYFSDNSLGDNLQGSDFLDRQWQSFYWFLKTLLFVDCHSLKWRSWGTQMRKCTQLLTLVCEPEDMSTGTTASSVNYILSSFTCNWLLYGVLGWFCLLALYHARLCTYCLESLFYLS